jgi:hypothetical protein
VSLRHALVGARASGGELRVRLLDLQSGGGFFTEDGRRCAALTADGALFARIGAYHVFLLPTGSLAPLPWGRTADETWATIPERVYRDCRVPARPPALVREPLPVAAGGRRQTIITQIVDPPGMLRPFRPAAGARGAAVARIELGTKAGFERFVVHEAELERGLLVGRYDRCQIGTSDQALSRVHLLVIRDGDDCWTVDTASSNGTTWNGETVRRAPLRDGSVLVLARGIALRWRSVADADRVSMRPPSWSHWRLWRARRAELRRQTPPCSFRRASASRAFAGARLPLAGRALGPRGLHRLGGRRVGRPLRPDPERRRRRRRPGDARGRGGHQRRCSPTPRAPPWSAGWP